MDILIVFIKFSNPLSVPGTNNMSDIAQKTPADLTPLLLESLREIQKSRHSLEENFLSDTEDKGEMGLPFYKSLKELFMQAEGKIADICQSSRYAAHCHDLEGECLDSLQEVFRKFSSSARHFSLGQSNLEDQRLYRHVLAAGTTVGLVHSTISIQIANETANACLAESKRLFEKLNERKETQDRKNALGLTVIDGGLSGTPKI